MISWILYLIRKERKTRSRSITPVCPPSLFLKSGLRSISIIMKAKLYNSRWNSKNKIGLVIDLFIYLSISPHLEKIPTHLYCRIVDIGNGKKKTKQNKPKTNFKDRFLSELDYLVVIMAGKGIGIGCSHDMPFLFSVNYYFPHLTVFKCPDI